ncbi:cathepsin L-like proteinase [Culicoides brevitarsis]|uniref:cathepsin L-like proteinase n=1 Tax=Culicoides brevitarsis TaxID=469753 RepID=UPI00307CB795
MKSLFVFAIIAVVSISAHSSLDEKWEEFKTDYRKVYSYSKEEQMRKQIFSKHLEEIEEHNARYAAGIETYEKGINQFSDLTYEEFAAQFLGENSLMAEHATKIEKYIEKPLRRELAPESFDWSDVDVPVKNQRSCGSCWAFASVASVEYRYKKFFNKSYTLAEQELVDCDVGGCKGGRSDVALEYVRNNGLSFEKDYPYKAVEEECHVPNNEPKAPVTVKNVYKTAKDEVTFKDHFYQYGPLVVYYFADKNFQSYKKGVFMSDTCNLPNSKINHAVLIVGYGNDNGLKYWLARNSWGKNFGEDGYFRIVRDANMCNMAKHPAIYPEVA